MKQILLYLSLVLLTTGLSAQVVYVDVDATGSGDGTSWADAYTDLATAIDSADAGSQLWIAAGRYVTPSDTSFIIDRELGLYGGFNGTETMASEADPKTNETILSGDVLGNDPIGVFDSLLMSDNNRVLTIVDTASTSRYTVTLDGLTIRDGAIAADFPGGVLLPYAGGGIYSEAKLAVSRVLFTANRADFGSATCVIFGSTAGSTFDDVTTRGNYTEFRNNHYIRLTDSVTFSNSTFVGDGDSLMNSGMISTIDMNALVIDNCSFDSINAPGYRGAAVRTTDGVNHQFYNTTFNVVRADLGGALYLRNDTMLNVADRDLSINEVIIDSCSFNEVSASRWGGAIFFGNISHSISNSSFVDGIGAATGGIGGAVYAQNTDILRYNYSITDSEFLRNQAGGSGGAVFYFSDGVDVTMTGNVFSNNSTLSNGGGAYLAGGFTGFRYNALVRDNMFNNNSANSGTLFITGAGADYNLINNTFEDNGADGETDYARAGGIGGFLDSGDTPTMVLIDSSSFIGNVISNDQFISGGAAIYFSGDPGNLPTAIISNSYFERNSATDAADGTIEFVNGVDAYIDNCDFYFNNSAGAGGAINVTRTSTLDSLPDGTLFRFYDVDDEPRLSIDRSLFVNNSASVQGGAINLFSASISMQNSILINNAVSTGGGSGGGVIINGSTFLGAELDNYFINNTFYQNQDGGSDGDEMSPASAGNAIAVFQPGNVDADTNSLRITLQNNAFFLESADEESVGLELNVGDADDMTGFGPIEVVSLGGNYYNSATADDLVDFTGEDDIIDVTVAAVDVFVDPLGDNLDAPYPNVDPTYTADDSNPLVDGGTTGPLVPEYDFFNNDRDNMPDIGAVELDSMATSLGEPIEKSGLELEFFPNPTVDRVNIVNNDASVARFTVMLSDMSGRFLDVREFSATNNVLDVSTLPVGVYNLSLMINGKLYSKQIMKQ